MAYNSDDDDYESESYDQDSESYGDSHDDSEEMDDSCNDSPEDDNARSPSPPRPSSETSSTRERCRIGAPQTYRFGAPVEHTLQAYIDFLSKGIQLNPLKEICTKLGLGKCGNKPDFIQRIANRLYDTFLVGDAVKFDEMVALVNQVTFDFFKAHGAPWYVGEYCCFKRIPPFPDPEAIAKMKEISSQKNYDVKLPTGTKIETFLSEKIYIPAAPKCSLSSLKLDFNITPEQHSKCQGSNVPESLAVANKIFVVGLLIVKCYEDAPEGQPKFRIAKGHYFENLKLFNCNVGSEDRKAYLKIPFKRFVTCRVGKNTATFSWASKNGEFLPLKPYIVQVVLLSSDQSAATKETSEDVKKKFLARASKSDIMASSLTLSLRCPLSFVRMITPIRFKSCTHLQCLELSSWLSYTKTVRSPSCPVCNKPCISSEMIIDGFTQEVLKDTTEDIDSVIVDVENKCAWSLPRSSSEESMKFAEEKRSGTGTPLMDEEPVYIDLTADDAVYAEPWVQPVKIKPDPGVPAEMRTGGLIPVVPQVRSGLDEPIDLTLDSTPIRNLVEVIEILD